MTVQRYVARKDWSGEFGRLPAGALGAFVLIRSGWSSPDSYIPDFGCRCAEGTCPHESGCAVHNEPAMRAGPCDCGVAGDAAKGRELMDVTLVRDLTDVLQRAQALNKTELRCRELSLGITHVEEALHWFAAITLPAATLATPEPDPRPVATDLSGAAADAARLGDRATYTPADVHCACGHAKFDHDDHGDQQGCSRCRCVQFQAPPPA